MLVVGSEGKRLSRLARESCDVTGLIPMPSSVESLNASVTAGVLLAEVARRRPSGRLSPRASSLSHLGPFRPARPAACAKL